MIYKLRRNVIVFDHLNQKSQVPKRWRQAPPGTYVQRVNPPPSPRSYAEAMRQDSVRSQVIVVAGPLTGYLGEVWMRGLEPAPALEILALEAE